MESKRVKNIRDLILPILEFENIDLVDIELKGKPGAQVLRIFVDIDGGIPLEKCVSLNREFSDILERKDIMAGRYRLEVSSPGFDRPLKTARDFERNIGRKIKVEFITDLGDKKSITGIIEEINDNELAILNDNQQFKIDLSKIAGAKVIPVW